MRLPLNIIANADDFGFSGEVNRAILFCFEQGIINSASLLTNMPAFDEAVQMIKANTFVKNIGVHINLAEGRPLTNVGADFLLPEGNWDLKRTGKILNRLSPKQKAALQLEINTQIEKALHAGVAITHLDSHYHLHTLPALSVLFLKAAREFHLKLRLAQTYREGSYIKFAYRKYINNKITAAGLNYSDRFETVEYFLGAEGGQNQKQVEIMLHPCYSETGLLTDHYDAGTMENWLMFLKATAV